MFRNWIEFEWYVRFIDVFIFVSTHETISHPVFHLSSLRQRSNVISPTVFRNVLDRISRSPTPSDCVARSKRSLPAFGESNQVLPLPSVRFLRDEQRIVSLPATRSVDPVDARPRNNRWSRPGHVWIFSRKPVRWVHFNFATFRWKFRRATPRLSLTRSSTGIPSIPSLNQKIAEMFESDPKKERLEIMSRSDIIIF